MNVNWHEQCKIRIRRNASIKHEVIKLLIVRNLIEKYKRTLSWIRIYTEYPITEDKICDVYFENVKTKECVAYEIQKKINPEYVAVTTEQYEKWDKDFFKTDWVLVKENTFTDNINEINKKVKDVII
jgi:hypothetical protein